MVASPAPFSIAIIIISIFVNILPNKLNAAGFSVDLIHRDSPKSPFYNPSESHLERVSRAIRRSDSRVNYFISSSSAVTGRDVYSTVSPNNGNYLMSISLGTPPFQILAIADTGSDLIWIQCLPCESCYKQEAPLFIPSSSSTYVDLSCDSNACSKLSRQDCDKNGSCRYSYSYDDRSYTNGVLAAEMLTMNSPGRGSVRLQYITFGCGHDNGGVFRGKEAGVVGLGGGPLSLVSQLSPSVDKKFAYCLVPLDHKEISSRMDFGDSAVVSSNGVVHTPLISKPGQETFFYVNLQKISVGNESISLGDLVEGNIILDSGTTLTYLPSKAYQDLLSVLKDAIDLQPVQAPSNVDLDLCYEPGENLKLPQLTFEFDGAEVVLVALNTFIKVADNVVCFAFKSTKSINMNLAIIGSVAQQNFKIGYDLRDMKVAFQRTDCTHQ